MARSSHEPLQWRRSAHSPAPSTRCLSASPRSLGLLRPLVAVAVAPRPMLRPPQRPWSLVRPRLHAVVVLLGTCRIVPSRHLGVALQSRPPPPRPRPPKLQGIRRLLENLGSAFSRPTRRRVSRRPLGQQRRQFRRSIPNHVHWRTKTTSRTLSAPRDECTRMNKGSWKLSARRGSGPNFKSCSSQKFRRLGP